MACLINTQTRFIFTFLLILISVLSSTLTWANQCLDYIPRIALSHGELRICRSAYTGIDQNYACQEYQVDNDKYHVLYNGGLLPIAILAVKANQKKQLLWSSLLDDEKLSCPLLPPRGIHIHAKHNGTGVCLNENNLTIPCSIYEYSSARRIETQRYMAFYDPSGNGPTYIEIQVLKSNQNVMVAELAYQIGLSLLDTECCRDSAMAYLEYAYFLFPNEIQYSKAYNNAKFLLTAFDL